LGTEIKFTLAKKRIEFQKLCPGFDDVAIAAEKFEDFATDGAVDPNQTAVDLVDVDDDTGFEGGNANFRDTIIDIESAGKEEAQDTGPPAPDVPDALPLPTGRGNGSKGDSDSDGNERWDRLFCHMLAIPGMMHVLHNAVHDVKKALEFFPWFMKSFKVFCRFMKKKFYRDRVIGICFSQPPASWHQSLIKTFSPDLTDIRWGFLLATIRETLVLEVPLLLYWDREKIDVPELRGLLKEAGYDDGDDDDVDEGRPSDFVTSKAHWAYAKMLDAADSLVLKIEAWAWQCHCHPIESFNLEKGASWQKRSSAFRRSSTQSTTSTCILRGTGIGDIPTGGLETFLDEHIAIETAMVLVFTVGLSVEDRHKVLADFEKAHQHIKYVILLKLLIYKNNPYMFLSLGCICLVKARNFATSQWRWPSRVQRRESQSRACIH
jgi:hypothetical protein